MPFAKGAPPGCNSSQSSAVFSSLPEVVKYCQTHTHRELGETGVHRAQGLLEKGSCSRGQCRGQVTDLEMIYRRWCDNADKTRFYNGPLYPPFPAVFSYCCFHFHSPRFKFQKLQHEGQVLWEESLIKVK